MVSIEVKTEDTSIPDASYAATVTTGTENAFRGDKEDHQPPTEDKASSMEAPQDEAEEEACPPNHTRCHILPGNKATNMTNEVTQCPPQVASCPPNLTP